MADILEARSLNMRLSLRSDLRRSEMKHNACGSKSRHAADKPIDSANHRLRLPVRLSPEQRLRSDHHEGGGYQESEHRCQNKIAALLVIIPSVMI